MGDGIAAIACSERPSLSASSTAFVISSTKSGMPSVRSIISCRIASGSVWLPATRSIIAAISRGAVARVVGIEGGVVSEVINLESSGVRAPDRRPRHDQHYHEDRFLAA